MQRPSPSRKRPLVFTQHGAIQAATILNSPRLNNSAILGFIPARRVGAERRTPRVDEIARADGADAAGVVVSRMRSESRFVARIRR